MSVKKSYSTAPGYLNRNNQKNIKRLEEKGSGNNQWYYLMECQEQECNFKYKSNGADIFQRKCPKCQGGKP